MKNSSSSSGGIGFVGLLTIAFVVLKLCKVINWSWIWVLSPIWISVALLIIIVIIMVIYAKKSGGKIHWRFKP